ncbi:MAG: PilN domain-containing protein [Halieaceae bacterium]
MTPDINLLPWRESSRQARKRHFLLAVGATCLAGMLLVLSWGLVVDAQRDQQQLRNRYLEEHIALLDQQLAEIGDLQRQRIQLIERMRVIESLQGNRPAIVRLLDQLVRTVPEGVFYTSVKAAGNVVSIEGVSESNNRVSTLMRNLGASAWLENPNLDAIQAAPKFGDQAATFRLTVNIQSPILLQQETSR